MSDETARITSLIVIPCLNQLEYTKKTLASIELKPHQALCIINNNSTDGSREFFLKMAEAPNTYFLDLPQNVGVSNSWNAGIELGYDMLKCDIVILLNNDIILREKTLEIMERELKTDGVGLISACDIMSKCANEEEFFKLEIKEQPDFVEEPEFSCFAINRTCYERVGYFDEYIYPAYFEDNDYHYRMKLAGLHAYKDRNNYYWHYGSRTRQSDPLLKEWLNYCYTGNEKYYKEKWGGEPEKEKYTIPFEGAHYERGDLITYEEWLEKYKGISRKEV